MYVTNFSRWNSSRRCISCSACTPSKSSCASRTHMPRNSSSVMAAEGAARGRLRGEAPALEVARGRVGDSSVSSRSRVRCEGRRARAGRATVLAAGGEAWPFARLPELPAAACSSASVSDDTGEGLRGCARMRDEPPYLAADARPGQFVARAPPAPGVVLAAAGGARLGAGGGELGRGVGAALVLALEALRRLLRPSEPELVPSRRIDASRRGPGLSKLSPASSLRRPRRAAGAEPEAAGCAASAATTKVSSLSALAASDGEAMLARRQAARDRSSARTRASKGLRLGRRAARRPPVLSARLAGARAGGAVRGEPLTGAVKNKDVVRREGGAGAEQRARSARSPLPAVQVRVSRLARPQPTRGARGRARGGGAARSRRPRRARGAACAKKEEGARGARGARARRAHMRHAPRDTADR